MCEAWEQLLKEWSGESVIIQYDQPTGAWMMIAIHSTRLGPATGGTRMKWYPNPRLALEDALRLSEGMTLKFAIPGIACGGGKAVIVLPADFDSRLRPDLLRRYGKLIHQLGGLFRTGPDVGTTSTDMDLIAETGAPYVFCRTPVGGGAGPSGPLTALGILAAMQVIGEHLFETPSLKGRRVLVQGTGSVGGTLIRYLLTHQAEVLFHEVDQAMIDYYRDELGLECISSEDWLTTQCDILAPCALGGILNQETIPKLGCRAIAGGANNQLATPEDAERLLARGVLYAPDFVVNVGGAMGIPCLETLGWTQTQTEQYVFETIQGSLRKVFQLAVAEQMTPEKAARQIAELNLSGCLKSPKGTR